MMAQKRNVIVIGGGIAGLTTACLLTQAGICCTILEQNWLPGGCATSYPRKHYIFESGATTLVGLDQHMPLRYLMDQLQIDFSPTHLEIPMKVYLANGKSLIRHQNLDRWIEEAERVFGPKNQRAFWEYCYKISNSVWECSLQQKNFPPSRFVDWVHMAKNFRLGQLQLPRGAFSSVYQLLKKFDLHSHPDFVPFVNEQLLITAQNHMKEVNVLFGATALCYTNYGNYYVQGGLINLVRPLVNFLEAHGSSVQLREPVQQITKKGQHYIVKTKKEIYQTEYVVSAIPINNTLDLFETNGIQKKYHDRILHSQQLNSAFQLGFVAKKKKRFDCLHHQIHLKTPLPYSHSDSIFLSLSHPDDEERCGREEFIGSVSTHVHHPEKTFIEDKDRVSEVIFEELERLGFLNREDVVFYHASTPKAWKKWTGRSWGFVGGYPQYMKIKPWQMLDARLDHQGAYICGDSTYPGQGIPGACLSGIIAFEKMKVDGVVG